MANEGRRRPISSGEVPRFGPGRRTRDISCPACGAVHLFAYAAPTQPQDKEDVPFACMACGAAGLRAADVPERVGYRVSLTRRSTRDNPTLAWLGAWTRENPLFVAAWTALLVFAVESALAWRSRSPRFSLTPFQVMRVVHDILLCGYLVTLARATPKDVMDQDNEKEMLAAQLFGVTALASFLLLVAFKR